MIERPPVVSAGLADSRGSALAGGLPGLVAELAVQVAGIVQVIAGLCAGTELDEGLAETPVRTSQRSAVVKVDGGGQRGLLRLRPVQVVPAPGQVLPEHGGQLPGVNVETAVRCGARS